MVVRGLKDADARALLDTVLTGDVDNRVRETIVAETGGNPLALLELPRGRSAAELTFGFGLADAVPLETHLEHGFTQRLGALAQTDAAVPACRSPRTHRGPEPAATGHPAARCRLRGGGSCRAGRPDRAGRPSPVPTSVGAICRGSSRRGGGPADRPPRSRRGDRPGPRSRPSGVAPGARSGGPDEEVAVDLERSADRARARGGLAAQAAFLERAIELTNDPARRPARILAAARARHQAGSSDAALTLLAEIEAASLDERTRAAAGGSPGTDSVLLQP